MQLISSSYVSWIAFGLGLTVAICAATQEFFKFGDRWRHYRRIAETLKSEGWQYFQRSGPYRRFQTHLEGYPTFAARVEALFQGEVQIYLTEVAAERPGQESETPGSAGHPAERNGGPTRTLARQPWSPRCREPTGSRTISHADLLAEIDAADRR